MTNNLETMLLSVEFPQAKKFVDKLPLETFREEILFLSYENQSIINYSFLNYLLGQKETADLHELAFAILVNPLCHIEGAYISALYHAKRAVELTNRQDVGHLENLLFLHSIPDKLIDDDEAMLISNEILILDPSSDIAKETISELS